MIQTAKEKATKMKPYVKTDQCLVVNFTNTPSTEVRTVELTEAIETLKLYDGELEFLTKILKFNNTMLTMVKMPDKSTTYFIHWD